MKNPFVQLICVLFLLLMSLVACSTDAPALDKTTVTNSEQPLDQTKPESSDIPDGEDKAANNTDDKENLGIIEPGAPITNNITEQEPPANANSNLSLQETADVTLDLIATKNFKALSNYIHPDKGVSFSPYVYIEEDTLLLQKDEVAKFFEDDNIYQWGHFDGSGEPIKLTPREYFEQFIYNQPFKNADEVLINEHMQRGNTINNIKQTYPNSSVVEFHRKGSSDFAGMDWASLNLVFEKTSEDSWALVAIVNDCWTI